MTHPFFYLNAIKEALSKEMHRDGDVYLFGEEIAQYGNVFGVTKGFFDEFGQLRVRHTPLSEGTIIGQALGAAIYGIKSVAEIQSSELLPTIVSPPVDLAVSHLDRIDTRLPLTIRSPSADRINVGNFHPKNLGDWFVHVPALKAVMSSTAHGNKGFLTSAIGIPDPLLFLEHKQLYQSIKDCKPQEPYALPIEQEIIAKPGKNLSLFNYGAMVYETINNGSVFKLVVVFICNNKNEELATPLQQIMPIENIPVYGMPGKICQGNKILEIYLAVREAVVRSRAGDGHSFDAWV